MAAANANVGDLLGDDVEVFRAFADKSFRERRKAPPHRVRSGAFLLRDEDAGDGLSVGISPKEAVRHLDRNFGYCSIFVRQIVALPYGLQVRRDPLNPEHAFIVNLPLMTISDECRDRAMLIAGELARKANGITCDPYVPNGCPAVPVD